MPGAQVGLGLLGATGLAWLVATLSVVGFAAVAVESPVAVEVVVSVVWLLLHEASRPRAATGAAQRAEALFQDWNMKRRV